MRRRAGIPVAMTALILIAACGSAGSPTWLGVPAAAAHGRPASVVPADDERLIQHAVDVVNATAGGDPADQRAALLQVVEPARAGDQRSCRPATTTVRFEPAWADLRPAPGAAPGIYLLPTRIRIYTAERITGTDVTALTVSVSAGSGHLSPLCIS